MQKRLSTPADPAFTEQKGDHISYSVTFEMKGLMTKIKMDDAMTIDCSVDTFQIKDSQKNHTKEEKNEEKPPISKRDQRKLHILNQIMSSPLDDYEMFQ